MSEKPTPEPEEKPIAEMCELCRLYTNCFCMGVPEGEPCLSEGLRGLLNG
jgi:hypothetical protein